MNITKVSVITVCFNAEKIIENTLLSVLKQDYKNIEYVVIDGDSIDETVSVVKRIFNNYNRNTVLLSEKDDGIYNAMNKGVRISTGDFVIFMNAGDVFSEPTVISKLVQNSFDYDIIYGNHYFIRNNRIKSIKSADISKITEDSIICHQACMTRRALLIDSPFDETIKIAADYDFLLKQYIKGMKFNYINIEIVYYDVNGVSSNIVATRKEQERIRKKYNVISSKQELKNYIKWKIHGAFRLIVPRNIKDTLYRKEANHWYQQASYERINYESK